MKGSPNFSISIQIRRKMNLNIIVFIPFVYLILKSNNPRQHSKCAERPESSAYIWHWYCWGQMYFSMVISAHTTNWGSVQIKESSFSLTMLNDIRIQFLHHLFFVVCSRLTNKVRNICIIFKFYIKGIVRMKRKPICKLF